MSGSEERAARQTVKALLKSAIGEHESAKIALDAAVLPAHGCEASSGLVHTHHMAQVTLVNGQKIMLMFMEQVLDGGRGLMRSGGGDEMAGDSGDKDADPCWLRWLRRIPAGCWVFLCLLVICGEGPAIVRAIAGVLSKGVGS